MNKKFISAFMLGLLTLGATSTITSCKDYDGDISNLQTQIDNLSKQAALKSDIETLKGQIDAAKADAVAKADAAMKAAQNAQATADNAATKQQLADLQAAVDGLNAELAKKANQSALDDLKKIVDGNKEDIATALQALTDENGEILDAIKVAKLIAAAQGKADDAFGKAEENAEEIVKLSKKIADEYAKKTDLTDAIAKVETDYKDADDKLSADITSINGILSELQTKVNTMDANLADALDRIATLEKNALTLEDVNAEVSNAIAENNGKLDEKIAKQAEDTVKQINEELKDIIAAYSAMPTSVELYSLVADQYTSTSTTTTKVKVNDEGKPVKANGQATTWEDVENFVYETETTTGTIKVNPFALKFKTMEIAVDGTFGPKGEVSFKKGDYKTYGDSLVIRVNPVGATVTKEMISLVNTQNKSLDAFIDVTDVKETQALATRAVSKTGLYTVYFNLKKDYDAKEFAKMAATGGKSIAYAVALKNPAVENQVDERLLVSGYDATVAAGSSTLVEDILVNNVSFQQIHNRININGNNGLGLTVYDNKKRDYTWKKSENSDYIFGAAQLAVVAPDWSKTGASFDDEGVNVDARDRRSDKKDLALTYVDGKYTMNIEFKGGDGIRAFYVTLDNDFVRIPAEDDSERNAWNSYSYTGLNTVFEGNKGTISVNDPDKKIVNEEIGFRIYAVNYDGKLVDPDGIAYYVTLGNEVVADQTIDATIEAKSATVADNSTIVAIGDKFRKAKWVKMNSTNKSDVATNGIDVSKEGRNFHLTFGKMVDNAFVPCGALADFDECTHIKINLADTQADDAVAKYIDDKAYSLDLNLKNSTVANQDVYKVTVKTKKTVTKVFPESFKVQKGMEALAPYVTASNDDAFGNMTGEIDLRSLFNIVDNNYVFTIANAAIDDDDIVAKVVDNNVNYVCNGLDKDVIDGKAHALKVEYNYGKISSKKKNADGTISNYTVEDATSYAITFNYSLNSSTFGWYTRAEKKNNNGDVTQTPWGQPTVTVIANGQVHNSVAVFNLAAEEPGLLDPQGKAGILSITNAQGSDWSGVWKDYQGANRFKFLYSGDYEAKLAYTSQLELGSFSGGKATINQKVGVTAQPGQYENTLTVYVQDAFGHVKEVNLPFTVK